MKTKSSPPPKGFPKRVTLLGRHWQVVYHPRLADESDGNETELLGGSEESTRTIYISLDQQRTTLSDTLVHEMMHSLYRSFGGLPSDYDVEESIVLYATAALFEILRNQQVRKLVLETCVAEK